MSDAPGTGPDSLPISVELRLAAVCDRFEQGWKAGGRPRVEDHLADADPGFLPAFLSELLRLELEYRFLL